MVGLLGAYKDPKAQILYGGGNSKITDDQIRNFINTPGRTGDDIFGKALANGVSAAQVANAMKGTPGYDQANIDKYISGQGVSMDREPGLLGQTTKTPYPVKATPITVGNNETVQGQLKGILENPNSPLMVQARTAGNSYANKRGLLDSSIGASAAESSMINAATPIAQQDASTYYDAKKSNVANDLSSSMFNNDLTSRMSMFDRGIDKDLTLQGMNNQNALDIAKMSNELQRDVARMDSDNKLAIANIQAIANDSGIAGELGRNLMNLYQQTAADPNITPEVKDQIYKNLNQQSQNFLSLLPSINKTASNLNFSGASNSGGSSSSNTSGNLIGDTSTPSTAVPATAKANVLNYQVEPSVMNRVAAYEKTTGQQIDRSRIAPESLVMDLKYGPLWPNFGNGYTASDGTNKIPNWNAYDYPALMKQTGAKSQGELFDKLFIPVHPPGTGRADSPLFYLYR